MAKKKSSKVDWIDTPGLKHILESEVPLAAKLLKEGRKHVLVRGNLRTGKSHIRDRIREESGLKTLDAEGLNCAALNPNLIESELFGHKKGAFTGADKNKPGLLEDESDHPKVLFLEEIGELPDHIQAKLLVFLETGTFMPVGGTFLKDKNGKNDKKHSTIRIIATSNAEDDKFRPDFLARFWRVKVPAIHERREDIPLFLKRFLGREETKLTAEDLFCLMTYNWPGGISEIEEICIKIEYHGLKLNYSQQYSLIRGLTGVPDILFDNYFDYCHHIIDDMREHTLAKLFPHLNLSMFNGNKPLATYDYYAFVREWEAWCFFFYQNPKSPANIYSDMLSPKHNIRPFTDFFCSETLNPSFIKNTPMLGHFIDFIKEEGLSGEEGAILLNDLHKEAYYELFFQEKTNIMTEQQPSFENTKPNDYRNQFWEYQIEKGRTGSEIEKQYGIKKKTAEGNMKIAKQRLAEQKD